MTTHLARQLGLEMNCYCEPAEVSIKLGDTTLRTRAYTAGDDDSAACVLKLVEKAYEAGKRKGRDEYRQEIKKSAVALFEAVSGQRLKDLRRMSPMMCRMFDPRSFW